MICLKCEGKTKITNTDHSHKDNGRNPIPEKYRILEGPMTLRHVRCLDCGHRFRTVEFAFCEVEQEIRRKVHSELMSLAKKYEDA